MGFKKNVSSGKKSLYKGNTNISNLREESLNDNLNNEMVFQYGLQNKSKPRKDQEFAWKNKESFRRNMNERRVCFELFMIESEEFFEQKPLKTQMAEVAKKSSQEFQNWFYSLVVENKIPKTWVDFKKEVVAFCTDSGLEALRKYADEKWSDYLKRLSDFTKMHGLNEEEVIKKIRKEYAPQSLHVLFYVNDNGLNKIIEKVIEIENFKNREHMPRKNVNGIKNKETFYKKRDNNKILKNKSEITCFYCKELGHYANECPKKKEKVNAVRSNLFDREEKLDIRKVKINGKIIEAVFDTGAAVSIMTSKMQKKN